MIKGRWKKFLSALMIGTMVCSLAGCAKGQGEKEQVTLRIIWGAIMVYRQYKYGLLTGVLEMPSWLIGLAIPLSGIFSIIRMIQYEMKHSKDPEEMKLRREK